LLDLSTLSSRLGGGPASYAELRYQENRDLRLTLLNGQLVTNLTQSARGVSARAFSQGYWGFSSHSTATPAAALTALDEAGRNASFLSSRSKKSARLAAAAATSFDRSHASAAGALPTGAWIDFLKALDAWIAATYPGLQSRSVSLMALDMEKQFVNSDGTLLRSMVPRAHIAVSLTMPSSHGPVQYREVRGGLGQLHDQVALDPASHHAWIDEIHRVASEKADGVLPRSGVHDVILDPDLAGILAHEAVGHTTEADLVLGGSVAGQCLGQPVASELVSLVDFAHTYDGATCPQPVHVDDEGVATSDTVVIDRGLLKTFMHNRETAAHFDQPATGHARAFLFSDEPLIRMRNTAILPGSSKLAAMIESVEDGYYLTKPSNGQADTTGEFMFGVSTGFEIRGGKLARRLRETTISGVAFDMLKSVTMVSDDFQWESSGYCGKKQPMPVGMGGPAIKCRVHVGGQ
jgi:TldD protein